MVAESSKLHVLAQNAFFAAYFGFGAYIMRGIPWLAVAYLTFVAVMLLFVLRKHLCTHCCYYNKWCHCGWGKLAGALFRQKSGDYGLGGKLAGATWGLAALIPLVASVLLEGWVYGGVFLALTVANIVWHINDCRHCGMRKSCPGSAGK